MAETRTPSANVAILIKRAVSAYNASNFDQAIEHCRAALIALEGLDDAEAHTLIDESFDRLTMAYQRIGNYTAAGDVVTEWEGRTKRKEGRVLACIQHSRVVSSLGDFEEGARLANEAIRMAGAVDYPFGVGMAKRVRADLLWKLGHAEEALKLGQEALSTLEHVGEIEQQAAAHVTIAAAAHAGGQFYKSIEHLQRAARIVEQLGRQFETAIVYSNLGETYAEIYAMDKALEAHQKAIELVGMERAHPDLIRNLGVDLVSVGREEEGLKHLLLALERANALNDPDLVAQTLYSLAKVDLKDGNLDLAEKRGNEILEIANRIDSLRHRIRAWMILGEAAQRRGDPQKAQSLFNECSMAAQRASDRHAIWRTHAALHILFRESMPPLADIHRRIAAEMMTHILTGIEDAELRETFRKAEPVRAVLGEET